MNNLRRSPENKVIAGVCGAIADAVGIDTAIVRIAFVIFMLMGGSGLAVYVVLWILIPRAAGGSVIEDGIDEFRRWNSGRKNR